MKYIKYLIGFIPILILAGCALIENESIPYKETKIECIKPFKLVQEGQLIKRVEIKD